MVKIVDFVIYASPQFFFNYRKRQICRDSKKVTACQVQGEEIVLYEMEMVGAQHYIHIG